MKVAILVLLCVAVANARWAVYTAGQVEGREHHIEDMDWWEHAVFYQIYPSSFKDSDGDGLGDLVGITNNLQHLADLGVDGAWLSPIFDSPMVDGGYDIRDFKKVNSIFGTNEDLVALFAKAKELGIKIILDFVPNHTSDDHEWFKSSANREEGFENFYVWADCTYENGEITTYPNNWLSVFGGRAWTWHPVRQQCYLHQFTKEQPDLNYVNPVVYQEMIDMLEYWLEQGADGFRIDAINHLFEEENFSSENYKDANGDLESYENMIHDMTMDRPESYEFIYKVREMMDAFVAKNDNVTRVMMTEAYASLADTIKWYGNDSHPGAHMPFNFALVSGLDKSSNALSFNTSVSQWIEAMPDDTVANWVMGNHDRSRVGSRYGEERHEGLAIMTMALPGINVVYYGEEILMTDNREITWEQTKDPQALNTNPEIYMDYSRDPVRTPFQWDETTSAGFSTNEITWLPVHANYETQNLKAQKGVANSTFTLYQNLIKLRKANHALMAGEFASKSLNSNNVFAFTRSMEGEKTLAVFLNLGVNTTVSLKNLLNDDEFSGMTSAEVLIANNNSTLKIGDTIEDYEAIVLGPGDALILEVSSASQVAVSFLLIALTIIKFVF